jgi:hypothetical protein
VGWDTVIYLVVAAVISYALRPTPQDAKPASLEDVDIPLADEGTPVTVIFGEPLVKHPTTVWYGDLRYVAIKSKGGK